MFLPVLVVLDPACDRGMTQLIQPTASGTRAICLLPKPAAGIAYGGPEGPHDLPDAQ